MIKPEPKIVPIVNVNFENLVSEGNFKCEIKQPFKMSDFGITNSDDLKMNLFVKEFNHKYKLWVKNLVNDDLNFKKRDSKLLLKSKNITKTKDQIIFYGSSTIRLWTNLKKDFPNFNVQNFGFGGALISSLSKNFNLIFKNLNPKIFILYMGGNDLSKFNSSIEIVNQQLKFIKKIRLFFPQTKIINLSIKPSFERLNKISIIKKINQSMLEESISNNNFNQLDFLINFLKMENFQKIFPSRRFTSK